MTQCSEIDGFLRRYERFGVELGLDRILALLERLGNPHQRVPIVHVAGTNGKGSVCAYLSSVLTAAGYRTGRYTSPHLVDWTERITLNDKPVSPDALLGALKRVEAAIEPGEPTPTQFEVFTAAAWCIFAESAADVAVVEVGLGGRLDATNVCDRPLATLITSLSREHWQRLGPTLADIAREKAGILKPGYPAIIGPLPPEAETVVRQRIEALGCPVVWQNPAQWIPDKFEPYPWAIADDISYPLPLAGDIQLTNSALAIAALKVLQQRGWTIPETAIQAGMAQTQWPGRLHWTTWEGMRLLVDGAHNPAAAKVLRQYVDTVHSGPVHWLMGMLSTKDHRDIFEALLRKGDRLTLVPVPGHSTAAPQELAELAQWVCPNLEGCDTALTLTEGLQILQRETIVSNPLNVLCGSLYLVGKFYEQQRDLQEFTQKKTESEHGGIRTPDP
ncbi:bifunctional folylpolyglutamate synthase/dihydrofolate synthase [Altericista sp. CCNU0014]|uniref:bifunctional folylpolyglutamate synthase/dihydrofolate synthase n=1 Tax=Altericista sp. CCNU0014 TaxID=3082949 RepID=UPI00384FECA2